MDVHIFYCCFFSYFHAFFFFCKSMAQILLTNTLLSYQTSKNQTRFINIHIKLSKKSTERERENTFQCVWRYLIELKTHARSEHKGLMGSFLCFQWNSGNNIFSSGKYTHIYIYIYRFTCVRRKRYIEQRLETQREDKGISCRKSDHCFVSATKVEIVWDREEKLQHNCFV